jgi:hypothetical protein
MTKSRLEMSSRFRRDHRGDMRWAALLCFFWFRRLVPRNYLFATTNVKLGRSFRFR